jgi:hypothetical protein
MRNKKLRSLWVSLIAGTLALIAAFSMPVLERRSEAQAVSTCVSCHIPVLVIEQSVVECGILTQAIEDLTDRKFLRFQIEVRSDPNNGEYLCEIIAVK